MPHNIIITERPCTHSGGQLLPLKLFLSTKVSRGIAPALLRFDHLVIHNKLTGNQCVMRLVSISMGEPVKDPMFNRTCFDDRASGPFL
jgi:hypothetical protein